MFRCLFLVQIYLPWTVTTSLVSCGNTISDMSLETYPGTVVFEEGALQVPWTSGTVDGSEIRVLPPDMRVLHPS